MKTRIVGQKIKTPEGKYIIAQVEANKVCLISLINGNRWADPIEVKNIGSITEEEFIKMSGELCLK
jgi:hypothetical protein